MSDAGSPWRTFTSDAADGTEAKIPPDRAGGHAPSGSRLADARVSLGIIAGGSALAGAGVVALLLVMVGGAPGAALPGELGQPLLSDGTGDGAGLLASSEVAPDAAGTVVVDVAGAVARPGLHRLARGQRVGDAIAAAGGYSARVDLAAASATLNLASPLVDGDKVLVPELGFADAPADTDSDPRVDLNRADRAELETLPGIGPVTAGKIISARTDERFENVRQLRTRGVVGESVFERIRDLVRVSR